MDYAYFSTGLSNGEVWQKAITQDFFDGQPEDKQIITNYHDLDSGEIEDRRVKMDATGLHVHTTRFIDFQTHPTLDKVIYPILTAVLPYTDAGYQATYSFTVIDQTAAEAEGFVFEEES